MAFDTASIHQCLAYEAPVVGGIEAGGTKFVCAIGSGPGPLLRARRQFPTGNDPGQTMREIPIGFDTDVNGAALGEARFLASVRGHFRGVLYGYIPSPELEESGIDRFIVPPALGDDAGVYGALALAHDALAARAIQ